MFDCSRDPMMKLHIEAKYESLILIQSSKERIAV